MTTTKRVPKPRFYVKEDCVVCQCREVDHPLQVLRTLAGTYYIGQRCPDCGPMNRLSGFYPRHIEAELDLPIYQSNS